MCNSKYRKGEKRWRKLTSAQWSCRGRRARRRWRTWRSRRRRGISRSPKRGVHRVQLGGHPRHPRNPGAAHGLPVWALVPRDWTQSVDRDRFAFIRACSIPLPGVDVLLLSCSTVLEPDLNWFSLQETFFENIKSFLPGWLSCSDRWSGRSAQDLVRQDSSQFGSWPARSESALQWRLSSCALFSFSYELLILHSLKYVSYDRTGFIVKNKIYLTYHRKRYRRHPQFPCSETCKGLYFHWFQILLPYLIVFYTNRKQSKLNGKPKTKTTN